MIKDDGGGSKAEEAVRIFFLQTGYFVVRGIKYRFIDEEITDIDVWAYGKGSPTHRSRVVVDCKYKMKHAQVFERILWTEGLRKAISVEHAVVATTDRRAAAIAFAARMQIRLIGPELLDRLIEHNEKSQRLSEEEFYDVVVPLEDKLVGRFKERIEASKSRLLKLDFDSANLQIEDITYYAQESTRIQDRSKAVRLFYLSTAYLLITLDFILRDAPYSDERLIKSRIEEGIRFGSRGRAGVSGLLGSVGKKKQLEMIRTAEQVRADILAEFFGKYAGGEWLLRTALELEGAAFQREFLAVGNLSPDAASSVGILLDFLQISRSTIFDVAGLHTAATEINHPG